MRMLAIVALVSMLLVTGVSAASYIDFNPTVPEIDWSGPDCLGPIGDMSALEQCQCGLYPSTAYQPGGLCCQRGICR